MAKFVDPQTGLLVDDGAPVIVSVGGASPPPAAPPPSAPAPLDPAAAAYLANPTPENRAAAEARQAALNPPPPVPAPSPIVPVGPQAGDVLVPVGGSLVPRRSLAARDTPLRVPSQQSTAPAAPPQPAMIRQTTSAGSRKTTPAQYSKAEVASAQAAIGEREKAAGSIKELQERGVDAMRTMIAQQIADRQMEADSGNLQAREGKARLDALNAKLDGYSTAIENAKVDPQRLISQMTTTQRVLLTIGQMLGGYVEGATMGKVKNAATAMLNRAVEQDLAAQRANIAKITAQAGMTGKQAAQVMIQWQAGAKAKKDAMLALAGLQLTAAGLESKEADIAAKYHDVALGLKLQSVDVSSKGRDKTTRTSSYSSRMVPNPAAKATAPDMPTIRKAKDEVKALDAGLETARRLRILLAKSQTLPLGARGVPGSIANEINGLVKDLALGHRKAMGDSGPITEKDIPNFDRISDGRWTGAQTMLTRLKKYEDNLRTAKVRTIRSAFASPADLAAQAQQAQAKIGTAQQTFGRKQ